MVCAAAAALALPAMAQYGNAGSPPPNGAQNGQQNGRQNGRPDGPPGGQPDGRPHGPPPEAIAACKGKAEGAKAQFTGRRGELVSGTCKKLGNVVAVLPAGVPPPAGNPAQGNPPPAGKK